jgi:hypothetical protein
VGKKEYNEEIYDYDNKSFLEAKKAKKNNYEIPPVLLLFRHIA